MSPLFKKLNLGDRRVIHVINAPRSFEPELSALQGVTVKRKPAGPYAFAMAFVVTQAGLDAASRALISGYEGDAVLWMVYPKGTSKNYRCEFNRDSGWHVLSAAGFETVRMVAVDEDWSALRFRRSGQVRSTARRPAGASAPRSRPAPRR